MAEEKKEVRRAANDRRHDPRRIVPVGHIHRIPVNLRAQCGQENRGNGKNRQQQKDEYVLNPHRRLLFPFCAH